MSSTSSSDEHLERIASRRRSAEPEQFEVESSYGEESEPVDTGPEISNGLCVKYGSQKRLLAVEMGLYCTKPRAFSKHPDEVEPKALDYASAIETYTRVTEDKPPLLPLLFSGQVQIALSSHQVYVLPEALLPALDMLIELMEAYEQTDVEPMTRFEEEMPCAAKHEGVWCRAKVVAPPEQTEEGTFVEIVYVDWGNGEKLPIERVFPLLADFGCLPPLALKCRIIRELPDPTNPADVAKMESDLQDVLEEIGYRVKIELFNVDRCGTDPYSILAYVHPCAESPLAEGLAIPLLKLKPSDPSKITEETIAAARVKLGENIKNAENMRAMAHEADNYEEEDLDKILFPDIRDRTDEEWREYMKDKHQQDEADFRARRNRQRSGPSRKVQEARRDMAAQQALGLGPDTDIDFDRVPGQENAYFTRKRPSFVAALQHRFCRPWAANGVSIEHILTHVDNQRLIFMQTARNVRSLKNCEERLEQLYGPNAAETIGPINKDYITGGTPCVVFDDKQQRYVRATIERQEDGMIELSSLDRGYQLPNIPWEDRAKIKPLRAVSDCEGQPMVHRFKLRLASNYKPDLVDEQIFKKLMPEGSVWYVAVEDRKIPPPFRVDIVNLWSGENLREVYADEKEKATGKRPFFKESNYIPLGAARNANKRKKRKERVLEMQREESAPSTVAWAEPPQEYEQVIVTNIEGPQNLVVQTEKQADEVVKFGNKMTEFYKYRTTVSPKPIVYLSSGCLRLGFPCVTAYPINSPDFNYFRGIIVDVRPKDNPEQVRVLYTDYGDVSDWIHKHVVYPLSKEYSSEPAFAYYCCLDGFQHRPLQPGEFGHLQSRLVSVVQTQPPQLYTAHFKGNHIVNGQEKYCIQLRNSWGNVLSL